MFVYVYAKKNLMLHCGIMCFVDKFVVIDSFYNDKWLWFSSTPKTLLLPHQADLTHFCHGTEVNFFSNSAETCIPLLSILLLAVDAH